MMTLTILLSAILAAEADAPAGVSTHADHERLEQILRRPSFQQWKRRQTSTAVDPVTFWESLANRFDRFLGPVRWLAEQLSSLWQWLKDVWEWWFGPEKPRSSRAGSSGISSLLMTGGWIALIVVVPLLIYMMATLGRRAAVIAPTHILSRHQIRQALESGEALSMSDQGWIDLARQLEAEGDTRAIYRALYLALLSGLHRRGMIDFRLTRTNWYYVDRFRGAGTDRDIFRNLTRLFDDVWYGGRPAYVTGVEQVRQQVQSLLANTGATHAS